MYIGFKYVMASPKKVLKSIVLHYINFCVDSFSFEHYFFQCIELPWFCSGALHGGALNSFTKVAM